MPYDVQWDDEAKTIIISTVNANFSVHGEMAEALRDVVTLSSTVEHQVGSIMDWRRFQPSIPDNRIIYPKIEDERHILRRDFSSSESVISVTHDYWVAYAANTQQGAPSHKIAIIVFVFPDSITQSPMRTLHTRQVKFTTASHLDEARKMITDYFQQGNA